LGRKLLASGKEKKKKRPNESTAKEWAKQGITRVKEGSNAGKNFW